MLNNSINRWFIRYKPFSGLLFALLLGGILAVALPLLDAPVPLIVGMEAFMLLVGLSAATAAKNTLLTQGIRALAERCDPFPYLEVLQFLLRYEKKEKARGDLLVGYASALRQVGDAEESCRILKSLQIGEKSCYAITVKAGYYYQLALSLTELQHFEEAGKAHEKAIALYSAITPAFVRRQFDEIDRFSRLLHLYRRGEYGAVISAIPEIKQETRHMSVLYAMLYARTCYAMGDRERARASLEFTVGNGNRLYVVQCAAEMLRDADA